MKKIPSRLLLFHKEINRKPTAAEPKYMGYVQKALLPPPGAPPLFNAKEDS